MHINLESDYAVRIVHQLARTDARVDAKSLALCTDVPPRFALKILHKLVEAQIVLSFKGAQGGYALAREPQHITLRQVIEAVEGPYRFSRCLGGEYTCHCREGEKCPYQTVFDEVTSLVTAKLDGVTFADL